MPDWGPSGEKLGLPQAFEENVLSFLPINICPPSFQISVSSPSRTGNWQNSKFEKLFVISGKGSDSWVTYEVQLYIQEVWQARSPCERSRE